MTFYYLLISVNQKLVLFLFRKSYDCCDYCNNYNYDYYDNYWRNAIFVIILLVQKSVSLPVILVGGLRSMEEMQKVLNDTKIQFLSVSRPLLREPDLPNKLQSGKSAESQCISCNRCYSSPCHRCVFRK